MGEGTGTGMGMGMEDYKGIMSGVMGEVEVEKRDGCMCEREIKDTVEDNEMGERERDQGRE